jgi:mycothiol system anti-sigma-R factor
MIDCRHVIRRMWELLDGEVPPTEAEEIRAHLAECARCNPQYQFQLAFLSAVVGAHAGEAGPPSELEGRVRAALAGQGSDAG